MSFSAFTHASLSRLFRVPCSSALRKIRIPGSVQNVPPPSPTVDAMSDTPPSTFVRLVADYCTVIEEGIDAAPAEQARHLATLIARLYSAGNTLNSVWDDRLEHRSLATVTADEYEQIRRNMGAVLKDFDYYWSIDPLHTTEDGIPKPMAGQLDDDLADLWRDLKAGVLTWERETELDRLLAQWHWEFTFRSHWGTHAVEALRVLHRISLGQHRSSGDE